MYNKSIPTVEKLMLNSQKKLIHKHMSKQLTFGAIFKSFPEH